MPAHGKGGARATILFLSAPPSEKIAGGFQQAGKKERSWGEGIFARLLTAPKARLGWERLNSVQKRFALRPVIATKLDKSNFQKWLPRGLASRHLRFAQGETRQIPAVQKNPFGPLRKLEIILKIMAFLLVFRHRFNHSDWA